MDNLAFQLDIIKISVLDPALPRQEKMHPLGICLFFKLLKCPSSRSNKSQLTYLLI